MTVFNPLHWTRKILSCEGEVAAQLALEQAVEMALRARRPEALPKDKVLVSRALLEHAQRTSSDVVVRIAIHNALVNVDESRDPRNTPSHY